MNTRPRAELFGISFVTAIFIAMAVLLTQVGAQTALSGIHTKEVEGDKFLNYDFHSDSDGSATRTNVDNSIDLIFTGNATIDKVKREFQPFFRYDWNPSLPWHPPILSDLGKSPQHAKVYDQLNNTKGVPIGSGRWSWDSDRGMKTYVCSDDAPDGDPRKGYFARHVRIYAPKPDTRGALKDAFYNPSWRFYVIASSHEDHNECGKMAKSFGREEKTENYVAYWAYQKWDAPGPPNHVLSDHVWMANREGYAQNSAGNWVPAMRRDGDHYWLNNGWATRIKIP
jgi:hypothetical protein